jgi:hypothetical protein
LQLRTRWTGAKLPFVVRALQPDLSCDGSLLLVGEGLVSSRLDCIDLQLRDAFSPILLIFCDVDGAIRGCRMIAFPSLCRGGTHYPELVALAKASKGEPVDVIAYGESLASRLLELLRGQAEPIVERISIDMQGADGRAPLFQPSLRRWIQKVFRVEIGPCPGLDQGRAAQLFDELPSHGRENSSRKGGATLVVKHDMVPTIAGLLERRSPDAKKCREVDLPLLLGGREPAGPVILLEPPLELAAELGNANRGSEWPRLMSGPGPSHTNGPVSAIRTFDGRGLTDAELLLPLAVPEARAELAARSPISWLIEAQGRPEEELSQTVHSLALQGGGERDRMTLVGSVNPAVLSTMRERFGERLSAFKNLKTAADHTETPLVGFVQAGVILHDLRAADVMSRLLDSPIVSTSSCVVLHGEKPGPGWHTMSADLGQFVGSGQGEPADSLEDALLKQLWRSDYPVERPPRSLWLTRAANFKTWIRDRGSIDTVGGYHLCSFRVTASRASPRDPKLPDDLVPAASAEKSLRVQAHLG